MCEALEAWDLAQKQDWFLRQKFQRSYERDIVTRLKALPPGKFTLEQYGALSYDPARYPLFRLRTKNWDDSKPSIEFTGGMHGYEDSGILAATRFFEEVAPEYEDRVNILAHPCVSPLAYEIIHRWNHKAEDANRGFFPGSRVEESRFVMKSVRSLRKHFAVALDLHETNGLDPLMTADRRRRNGEAARPDDGDIPEGFYLYISPNGAKLGRRIIDSVRMVTPICTDREVFGDVCDHGLILSNNTAKTCKAFMSRHADISMTTEFNPDNASAREAQDGQMAAIRTSIEYALNS